MQKFLHLLLCAMALSFAACDEKNPPKESDIWCGPDVLNFLTSGGTDQVLVSCDAAWTATSNADWVSVSPASGTGTTNVQVICRPGTAASTTVSFACGNKTATLTVSRVLSPKADATLDDYLGTYTMSVYSPWDDRGAGTYYKNNVTIGYDATEQYIWLENLPYGFHAFGTWDAANHCIILCNEYYSPDDVFVNEGVNIAPRFTPVFYDPTTNSFYRTDDATGYAYIRLVMMSDGSLAMVPPFSPGTNGYYSNAFTYYLYVEDTWEELTYSDVFTDVKMVKNAAAPARGALISAQAPARGTATPARHTQTRPMTRENRLNKNISLTKKY